MASRSRREKKSVKPDRAERRRAIRRLLLDIGAYVIGAILYAVSVHCFSAPNQIAPGGATGVATLINFAFPAFPIGVGILLINLPLFILLWRATGWRSAARVVLVTVFSSVVIDLLALPPFAEWLPPFSGDRILVAIFGGVLSGFGLGLIYMRGASTGGSEIVGTLLSRRFPYIPVGRLIFLVDAAVIAASIAVYGRTDSALYAIIMVFVGTSLMNALIYGGDAGRVLMVVSRQPERIAAEILARMNRGATLLNATGAYSGEARQVLMCAVRRQELYRHKTIVRDTDPDAFIIVLATEQVLGQGFKPIEKE